MLNAWNVCVPERAWSPDGARLVLQQTTPYDHCTQTSGPPAHDILFAGNRKRIGHVLGYDASASHGHGITWSTDSDTLIVTNQITGSAVAGYVEMWAVDIHSKTRSLVVNKRVIGSPLVGPGGWIVFSRYRFADGASMGREEGTMVVGRLDPRPT